MGNEDKDGVIDFGDKEGNRSIKKGKKKPKASSGGFQSMGLSFNVLKGILKRGYQVPTPIQRKTIPVLLSGKDVVAMARTGSGKTAAFLIPLLEKLVQEAQTVEIGTLKGPAMFPKALILSPTRELALQTYKFAKDLSRYLNPSINIITILGGDSMDSQFELLHSQPHIVIATPGRFMHVCIEMDLKLNGVGTIIFDEADRLFEMGFGVQVNEIIQRLPINRQTILFSATMPKILVEFTKAGLQAPTLIRLDIETKLPENLQLVYLASRSEDKLFHLMYLLRNVIDIKYEQTIIFVATKYHVDYLHSILNEMDIPNTYIYSSLDSSARKISLDKFRCRRVNIMIVTDLAARGLDIPLLDNVINFHFPSKPKLFMHRVGRVARAGQFGTSYSIVSPDEVAYLVDLHLFLSKPLSFKDASEGAVLGRVPQEFIDQEAMSANNIFQNRLRTELEQLSKVSKNGYLQYIKSRPPASIESNRRAKGIIISHLPIHPSMFPHYKPDPLHSLIEQMHSFRPKNTIFEVGPGKKGKDTVKHLETHEIMKEKRKRDQTMIAKFRQQKDEEGKLQEQLVVDRRTKNTGAKDAEHFINYLPSDYHTETGLSVGPAADFSQQIQSSVLDFTGDDAEGLKSQKSVMKWDSKKKKFVGFNPSLGKTGKSQQPMKKIKTESGAWIAASYKSNRYQVWKNKSKVDHQQDESDASGDEGASSVSKQKPSFVPSRNSGPNRGKPKGEPRKRFKTEIKRPEVILKNRKIKEAKLLKNQKKGKGKKRQRRTGGSKK